MERNKLVNLSYLEEVASGEQEIIIEMLNIFREQVLEFTSDMKESVENKDWKAFKEVIHKAKSSVRVLGMENFAVRLQEVELIILSGDKIEEYPQYLEEFLEVFAHAKNEVDVICNS